MMVGRYPLGVLQLQCCPLRTADLPEADHPEAA